ncbi:MAG: DeoR/GlpR transcriptional regulator [Clostridia bacterium]|nr:DeoR/GlpR transcriptional regulator [Clostridia bacterium]
MLPLERRNKILEILKSRQAATVDDLCAALYSSGATIRRDLNILESNGLIRRTHGGAVHIESTARDFPLSLRESENLSAKEVLAQKALPYIKDGMTLFMDSSSTVNHLARRLSGFHNIRVITNGLKTASVLSEMNGIEVYGTGGRLRATAMSFVGNQAMEFVRQFNADIAFISCRGVDPDVGITDSDENEANLKRIYIQNAKNVILLCDNSKIGKRYFCKVAPLDGVRKIITNGQLPKEFVTNKEL